ncbi:GNAT family N-acetyltransferase [Streptococcus pluranimalium]|uniref:GNAT family N-acetyltransferase n=1 Tax=Streptococcus hyovaginalis TaxID=149015 RepID=UPI001479017E|nr:GNAT family N-acetyltransferase [Streptococcus hyovaginalis]
MIRRANEADIPRIQEFLGQILRVHHEVRPDIFKAQGSKFTSQELLDVIKDPKKPVFVYEDAQGNVLGHLFLILREAKGGALQPIRTLFIDDLCVDQESRGLGIGEQLYQFALAKARECGCYHLTLNVWNANEGAVRFYERMGMRPQEMHMETIIGFPGGIGLNDGDLD